jgi:hypothetical protein
MAVINLKINIDLIEQARLYPGTKGRYLDAVLFLNDQPDQFGNHGMIVQQVSKEEKEAGVRGPILGNCKLMGQKTNTEAAPPPKPLQAVPPSTSAPRTKKEPPPPMPPNMYVPAGDLPF